jgi:hypothetical protein
MSLVQYKPQFDNAYQEVFQKALVAKAIMNTRFDPVLKYGASVARVAFDISTVRVRTVTRGAASTIDTISDTVETLTINLEKELVFHISDGEITQAGPLNPGEEIGKQCGIKLAVSLDGKCFAEVLNATYAFDNGDLTGLAATGTPITLSSTTVPQMVSRMGAKLRYKNNQEIMTNMVFVVDSYAASDITQYLLGKNIDLAGNVFKNGYTGDVSNAQLYVSENLTGTATLKSTGTFSDGDTVTIGGVVFTMKTTLSVGPAVAGEVLIGANAAASITNLAAAINAPTTTTSTFTALSAANGLIITDTLSLVATATSATILTIVGTGSGRLILSKSAANWTWDTNFISCYFGKKGAIDLVIQDMKQVDMRATTDRRGTNVFSSYLAGIKTFADGAKKFLNVKILVS